MIPVFVGLFLDTHDDTIQELLFTCAHWHGLVKLRMHTDYTLQILEELTTKLGDQLRFFANETCLGYSTIELPHEAAAQQWCKAKKAQATNSNTKETSGGTCWKKTFNM